MDHSEVANSRCEQDFVIWRGGQPAERKRWIEAWSTWDDREVHAHPEYAELFARPTDEVLCAAQVRQEGTVLFPLIMRPLSAEWWATGEVVYDCVSPYGYGGPYAWGTPAGDLFWKGLEAWACRARVVSLFARRSLFGEQLLNWDGQVEENTPNVVRSLDLDPATMWMDYDHKVRKNVKKARAVGLTIERDETGQEIESFVEIYYDTLARRNAEAAYYFPTEFFSRICNRLPGQFAFFYVRRGEEVISAELVLVSGRRLYSFLGGTRASAFELRPNDLLKHEIITWGQAQGKSAFVLGGGYEAGDGIFRYKLSFAPSGCRTFYVGKRVFDNELVRMLVARRRREEIRRGFEWTAKPGYFPEYRG